MQQELVELILEIARDLGQEEEWQTGDLSADTTLYGRDGVLDSMGLVSLVIAVEQAIEDRYEKSVGLADEKAMSQSRSPYRSVARLAEYAASQLEEQ
jgi:D-alanine--poly(phosphoribitol) ligase subunit 2